MLGFSQWAIWGLPIFVVYTVIDNWGDIDDIESFFEAALCTLLEHKWTFIPLILGTVALGYFIVIGLIWVVKIIWLVLTSWITWTIVGSIAFIFGMFKLLKNLRKWRYLRLERDINTNLGIPVQKKSVNNENYTEFLNLYNSAKNIQNQVNCTASRDEHKKLKQELADIKLHIFYALSMKAVSGIDYEEGEFKYNFFIPLECALKDNKWNRLRKDTNEKIILNNSTLPVFRQIPSYIKLLNENNMDPILDKLESARNMNTSKWMGFVTDTKKLAEKTQLLKELYDAARQEYKELSEIMQKANYMLHFARVCAYRNIYLGAELLNMVRDNAGGSSLDTAKSEIDIDFDKTEPVKYDIDLKMDSTAVIMDSLSSIGNSFYKNMDFVISNPKESIGIAAMTAVGDYLAARNENINRNLDQQTEILTSINSIVDCYETGQANTLRAIEILKAIVKANAGFTAIYAPLRSKVFEKNDISSVTMQEMQQLARATSEYNKISKAEL